MLLLNFDREYKALRTAAQESSLYDDQLPKIYQRAKTGSVKDQYAVGMLYRRLGNNELAFAWLMKSAEKEHADSEYEIALIIKECGSVSVEDKDGYTGVYENPEPWLERAWVHGNADAAYVIAVNALEKENPDREKAIHWMRCSAERGGRCDNLLVASALTEAGDLEEALTFLVADAESGSHESALKASELLLAPERSQEDASKALSLLEEAIKNGAQSSARLFALLARAQERTDNFVSAFESYEKAFCLAELEGDRILKDLCAQKLGDMTYQGLGTTQNYTKAVEYFETVTAFTLESAKQSYADCKLRGLGTDKSVEGAAELGSAEAYFRLYQEDTSRQDLLERAAQLGHREALYIIGKSCFEKDDFSSALTYLAPLSKEHSDVPYMMGVSLARTGELKNALSWFELCAESGDSEGMYLAGKFHLEGMGCTPDPKRAVEYFKKSAAMGNANGAYELGMCCKNGVGTAKNPDRAAMLISAAAENGSAAAMFELANIKRLEDKEAAIGLYRRSAELGYENAMYQMGFLYEVGYITGKREMRLALEWYGKCRKSFKDVKAKISACSIELASQE